MSIKMNPILGQLATIDISKNIQDSINLKSVIDELTQETNTLDDLKKTREDIEKRGWWAVKWDSDKIASAQHKTIDIQTSMQKKIGQLLMVTILQAKALENQQKDIITQQNDISRQTTSIAATNKNIAEHHEISQQQYLELKSLFENYLSIDVRTTTNIDKLRDIANDTISISKEIQANFDKHKRDTKESIFQVQEICQDSLQTSREAIQAIETINHTFASNQSSIQTQIESIIESLEAKYGTSQDAIRIVAHEFKTQTQKLQSENTLLKSTIQNLEVESSKLQTETSILQQGLAAAQRRTRLLAFVGAGWLILLTVGVAIKFL